eukprot:m.1268133 g.1268133  ORF g.1268133 m.1268133 type:complete len:454 (-) comp24744_c0_seq13:7009-8370(-)
MFQVQRLVLITLIAVVASSEAETQISNCLSLANEYCRNATLSACPHTNSTWVALKSGCATTGIAWRCYSPDCLNEAHSQYRTGSGCTSYCSRNIVIENIINNCVLPSPPPPPVLSNATAVFVPGELGYPCIRIPSIALSGDGRTLNAFAECRNWTGDGCEPRVLPPKWHSSTNRDICQKQSFDGGKTWTGLRVIARNGAQGNPVFDTRTNKLLLQYTQLEPGDTMQMESLDNGASWSQPVSKCAGLGTECGGAVGPGIGLQLQHGAHAGRILFIGHFGAYGHDSVWYSDDNGVSYHVANATLMKMDEAQLVELADGTVLANMRTDHLNKSCMCRAVAVSTDGGSSFGPVEWNSQLTTPICMGSILSSVNGTIFFANPASTTSRVNGVLRRSDNGRDWTTLTTVWPGAYAYSCLTRMPSTSQIGLLWETDGAECTGGGASCRTVFSAFPVAVAQ